MRLPWRKGAPPDLTDPRWTRLLDEIIVSNRVKTEYAVQVTILAAEAIRQLHVYDVDEAGAIGLELRDAHTRMSEHLPTP